MALVAGILALVRPPVTEAEGPAPLNLERTQVVRGDLIETVRVQGTLGHGTRRDMGTRLDGTLTSIPAPGTIVSVGDELFRIDDLPVVMMHGELPVWRAFSEGMSNGNDVLQLEKSLAKLGYFRLTPDTRFTPATKNAVKYWQKSLGMKQTGIIEHGRIVFSSKDVRIQAAKAKAGSVASGEIISVTGVQKEIAVFLDTSARSLAKKNTKVEVSLPGGATEKGTVRSVGTPVEKEGTEGATRKIPVTVVLDKEKAGAGLQDVPVGVQFTQVKAKNVVQVPVSALLAQPGGGFAVEITAGGGVKLVPVKPGVFANGLVQVQSVELKAGDTVVVAK
ncbi:peptidoglycan-binding protein [Paeniglutamicibacter kerguelensis]|uniref:Peptidoglycan hydrolase-like protein with peptidoglycan-binding domain n=1 Tax=Paeniglutamicibacter kerguelensis TaxID=254788 RepID=A0ABS4XGE3_9MICC|nr:peptidoglycan hydrolase-like protein with peptidoglycan-binding domain [Paeniglutamicibacter kerguelensis]